MATDVHRIQRFVDKIDRRLRADEASPKTMRVSTRSHLDVVLRECGFAKRGSRNLALIQEALWSKTVYPSVDLTDLTLPLDQIVYFTRTPIGDKRQRRLRFPVHFGLEQFLVENFDLIFPNLRLVKTEYELPRLKVDMVARDRETRDWVAIELKPDRADRGVVSQIVGYMQGIRAAPPSKRGTAGVRGIVITGQSDPMLQQQVQALADKEGFRLDWLVYRIEMTLAPPVSAPGAVPLPAAGVRR
jgi:hypothetical protein